MIAVTTRLAECIQSLRLSDLPPDVVEWASLAVADTIACMVAGADEPATHALVALLPSSSGAALVISDGSRRHILDAAQINTAAAHAMDFDDCNLPMDGHPSVSIIPGLLALAESISATGAEFLVAYIAGIEAEIRLGRLVNPEHVALGWHPTATLGVVGAAAAASRLLDLDSGRTAVALSIAASCASGLRANSGSMTKPLHAAMAARNGVQAALLARSGFTANSTALEHPMGFLNAFSGPDARQSALVRAEEVLGDWGQRYEVLTPGIVFKQYPCCAFAHGAINAALSLRAQLGDPMQTVRNINVTLHPRRLKNIDRPVLRDGLDARFSTQYLVARALLDGGIRFASFDDDKLRDIAAATLTERIFLDSHQETDLSLARIEVNTFDGQTLRAQASIPMGRGPSDPMTPDEFRGKFMDCTASRLSESVAASLLTMLTGIAQLERIEQVTKLLAPT